MSKAKKCQNFKMNMVLNPEKRIPTKKILTYENYIDIFPITKKHSNLAHILLEEKFGSRQQERITFSSNQDRNFYAFKIPIMARHQGKEMADRSKL